MYGRGGYERIGHTRSCCDVFFPGFRVYSLTFTLTTVQVLVFLATWIASPIVDGHEHSYLGPTVCTLYKAGAKYGPSIRYHWQVYRLLAPVFLHAGLLHIAINVFSQLQIMFRFEDRDVCGPSKLIVFYLLCGVGANALSCLASPLSLSVGASGSLFGVFALLVAFLITRWHQFPDMVRNSMALSLLLLLGLNFGISFSNSTVDLYAHLGGFLCGLVGSFWCLEPPEGGSLQRNWQYYKFFSLFSFLALVAGLTVGIWFVSIPDLPPLFCAA